MKTIAIISGGDYCAMPNINRAELIVACDKGVRYAARAGITPNVVLGDFDSYRGKLPKSARVVRLPSEKDDTDTVAAIRFALEEGATDLALYCVEGGRSDHFIGNIQAAAFAASRGARVVMYGLDALYTVVPPGKYVFPRKKGYFSLFSLTGKCRGVFLSGAKYPLSGAETDSCFPLGVSNEWAEDEITLEFSEGVALIIETCGARE